MWRGVEFWPLPLTCFVAFKTLLHYRASVWCLLLPKMPRFRRARTHVNIGMSVKNACFSAVLQRISCLPPELWTLVVLLAFLFILSLNEEAAANARCVKRLRVTMSRIDLCFLVQFLGPLSVALLFQCAGSTAATDSNYRISESNTSRNGNMSSTWLTTAQPTLFTAGKTSDSVLTRKAPLTPNEWR